MIFLCDMPCSSLHLLDHVRLHKPRERATCVKSQTEVSVMSLYKLGPESHPPAGGGGVRKSMAESERSAMQPDKCIAVARPAASIVPFAAAAC